MVQESILELGSINSNLPFQLNFQHPKYMLGSRVFVLEFLLRDEELQEKGTVRDVKQG